MGISFKVDSEIENTSIYMCDLQLSKVYLKDDKETPWILLVPRKSKSEELVDLTFEEQNLLMEEITIVSEFLKKEFSPFKLNVGALGNIVRQLHIHIIARYENDRAWPGPVWGVPATQCYTSEEIKGIISRFKDFTH